MKKNIPWKNKVHECVGVVQNEIKKTARIGKKMFYASKTNHDLHYAYQELGELTAKALHSGRLKWDDDNVNKLMKTIQSFEENLDHIEEEVNQIKSSNKD